MTIEHTATQGPASPALRRSVPDQWSAILYRGKVLTYQAARASRNLVAGPVRLVRGAAPGNLVVAESRTALWSDAHPAERAMQLGKAQNLRQAVRRIDGVLLPPGAVFSFWRQLGRATRRRGFVAGRMLQEGCLVPAVGGGLCQLSNALYDAALQAGCEIVERHPHSRVVPGSAAALGRDATVAWNYVDLRFRALRAMQIAARVEHDALIVRFLAAEGKAASARILSRVHASAPLTANSCGSCGETSCFRHDRGSAAIAGRTAYLVDENWPEFRDYVAAAHGADDLLGLPLDGARWHLARYRWDTHGFARVASAPYVVLSRALVARRLPMQGAVRRAAELRAAERIAARLARLLAADVTHVCVAQSLLPFLWRDGHLGGRTVDVLMTRLPMAELQARLDAAAQAHPERATLADFRAPKWLVAAEAEALAYADRVATPHADIARLFAGKSTLLDWHRPSVTVPGERLALNRIAFSGPAVARAGAFAVRGAARTLGLEVVRVGSELEGADFWDGVAIRCPPAEAGPGDWLRGVAAVVQPAIVAGRPQHLLTALAAGVPVIASAACGLPEQLGLTLIPADDPETLTAALRRVLP